MRESRLYGSERGARREARSYRDPSPNCRQTKARFIYFLTSPKRILDEAEAWADARDAVRRARR